MLVPLIVASSPARTDSVTALATRNPISGTQKTDCTIAAKEQKQFIAPLDNIDMRPSLVLSQ